MYKVKFSFIFLLLLSVFLLVTLGHRYYFDVRVPNIYHPQMGVCTEVGKSVRENSSKGWKTFKQVLEDYKYFHHRQLSVLKNQALLHSSNPHHLINNSVRTLTWACETPFKCSGLGDQFYRIQLVFLLAIMTERVFIISWDKESLKTMRYLQPNEIDWSFFDRSLGMHTNHDIQRLVRRKHYSTLFHLLNSSKPHQADEGEEDNVELS